MALALRRVRRLYNAYLEGVWFAFPKYRTQPPKEHKLKNAKDLCGRDLKQLEELDWHNKLTACTQFALNLALYYGLPGYVRPPPVCPPEPDFDSAAPSHVLLILNCIASSCDSTQPRSAMERHRSLCKNAFCGYC